MKTNQLSQRIKRYTSAFVLSCFLLIGAFGLLPKSGQSQETAAYTTQAEEVAKVGIQPIGGFIPQGNFWSG